MTTPQMPEPDVLPGDSRYGDVLGYTADQMREYGEACAAYPLEKSD